MKCGYSFDEQLSIKYEFRENSDSRQNLLPFKAKYSPINSVSSKSKPWYEFASQNTSNTQIK